MPVFRLFRKTSPERPLLLLFRNKSCVVIGRNQVFGPNYFLLTLKITHIRTESLEGNQLSSFAHPWRAVHSKTEWRRDCISCKCSPIYRFSETQPLAKDLGNTNFSIHLPRAAFDRHRTARIVQRALVSLGIEAEVNERNDICVGGFKMSITSINPPVLYDLPCLNHKIRVWFSLQDCEYTGVSSWDYVDLYRARKTW